MGNSKFSFCLEVDENPKGNIPFAKEWQGGGAKQAWTYGCC
jgi:hypothetical protein